MDEQDLQNRVNELLDENANLSEVLRVKLNELSAAYANSQARNGVRQLRVSRVRRSNAVRTVCGMIVRFQKGRKDRSEKMDVMLNGERVGCIVLRRVGVGTYYWYTTPAAADHGIHPRTTISEPPLSLEDAKSQIRSYIATFCETRTL